MQQYCSCLSCDNKKLFLLTFVFYLKVEQENYKQGFDEN